MDRPCGDRGDQHRSAGPRPSQSRRRQLRRCKPCTRSRRTEAAAPRGLIAADVEGDGATDLIVTQVNAPPILLRNLGANKNHFARLDLTGYADNKTALGAKVEIFADGQWQKWELAGRLGLPNASRAADSSWTGQSRMALTCSAFSGRQACCRTRSICRTRGDRDERGRPPRQLVPGAVRMGRAQISPRHRRDWRRSRRPLVHANAAQHS